MAQKIYYVDPANGSNDNDGSSPDKAFKDLWSDNVDYGSRDEPSIFYIKRGTELIIPEDTDKDLPFGIIMSWPHSNDGEYWDNRPDDGKDWDDDDSVRANFYASNKSHVNLPAQAGNLVYFKNIDLDVKVDRDTDYFLGIRNSTLGFVDCLIATQKWDDDRNEPFIRFFKSDDDTEQDVTIDLIRVEFKRKTDDSNCNFVSGDTEYNYKKKINIIGCIGEFYRIIDLDNRNYIHEFYIKIDSANLKLNKDFLCVSTNGSSDNRIDINFINSHINANCIVRLCNDYNPPYYFNIIVENSKLTAKNYVFYNDNSSSDSISYQTFYAENSKLEGDRIIYWDDSISDTRLDVKITDCEFLNAEYVMSFYRVYGLNVFLSNNKYTNVDNIFEYRTIDYQSKMNVDIIENNIVVDRALLEHTARVNLVLTNSIVNKHLCNHATDTNIELTNCSVGPVVTDYRNVFVRAINTEFRQDGVEPLSGVSGYLENCKITNDDYDLMENNLPLNLIMYGCYLTGGVTSGNFNNSSVKLYSGKIGDDTMPYYHRTQDMEAMLAAPYRINGSEFSLLLNKTINNKYSYFGTQEIFTKFDPNHPVLTVFFATTAPIDITKQKISVLFKDSDGAKTLDIPVVVDTKSDWDGLSDDAKYYKATIDLSSYDIDKYSKVYFSYKFLYLNRAKIYLDTLVKAD